VAEGFQVTLDGKRPDTPSRQPVFDGEQQATVIALRLARLCLSVSWPRGNRPPDARPHCQTNGPGTVGPLTCSLSCRSRSQSQLLFRRLPPRHLPPRGRVWEQSAQIGRTNRLFWPGIVWSQVRCLAR
jgi:hypothetical protein